MASLSAVGGVGTGVSAIQLEAARIGTTLNMEKEAVMAAGSAALKLIQAASILDPFVGQNMDVLA